MAEEKKVEERKPQKEKQGKKPHSKSKHRNTKNYEKYVKKTVRWCPRCGPGTFLAIHKDRVACGKCGYAEIQKK